MEIIQAIFVTLVGVYAGVYLSEKNRKRKFKANWGALRAELEVCIQKATEHQTGTIMAPLYRLPTSAYDNCLSQLLADGEVSAAELPSITLFYGQVLDLNRGLDLVQSRFEVISDENDRKIRKLHSRNLLYSEKLIPGNQDEVVSDMVDVLNKHIK